MRICINGSSNIMNNAAMNILMFPGTKRIKFLCGMSRTVGSWIAHMGDRQLIYTSINI